MCTFMFLFMFEVVLLQSVQCQAYIRVPEEVYGIINIIISNNM